MGRIELIIGPMFAGKSTELIKATNRYKSINMKTITINHTLNNRFGSHDITTHDGIKTDAVFISDNFKELLLNEKFQSDLLNSDIVIIEELQFFNNAFDFVTELADKHNKIVIAAGLSGDYKREPFGDVLRLIPHAEKLIVLSALCSICNDGTLAQFTKRIVSNSEHTLIGAGNYYKSVCRKHHNDL